MQRKRRLQKNITSETRNRTLFIIPFIIIRVYIIFRIFNFRFIFMFHILYFFLLSKIHPYYSDFTPSLSLLRAQECDCYYTRAIYNPVFRHRKEKTRYSGKQTPKRPPPFASQNCHSRVINSVPGAISAPQGPTRRRPHPFATRAIPPERLRFSVRIHKMERPTLFSTRADENETTRGEQTQRGSRDTNVFRRERTTQTNPCAGGGSMRKKRTKICKEAELS